MKKKLLLALPVVVFIAALLSAGSAYTKDNPLASRSIDPIVSTDWLAANSNLKDLVIIDIRNAAQYGSGHINNAINIPFVRSGSAWVVTRDGLELELPDQADLFKVIGSAGIKNDSRVVIVNDALPTDSQTPPTYPRSYATRVADTLIYAGVKNVAVLDGGHTKWVKEGKALSKDPVTPVPLTYRGDVDKTMFVPKEYVREHIGKAVIIDSRDPDAYFGAILQPIAQIIGHIPTAKSLPSIWIWDAKNTTYKQTAVLEKMAFGVIGQDKDKEIIVTCGTGNNASAWWFVLTQALGYKNVKFYDGSAQEWSKYYDMVPYRWE